MAKTFTTGATYVLALGAAALILSQTAGAQNAAPAAGTGNAEVEHHGADQQSGLCGKAIHAGATPGSVRRLGRVGGTGIPGKRGL